MSGLSKICYKSFVANANKSILFLKKGAQSTALKPSTIVNQSRGSHGRTMFIRPGKFYTKKYFDMIHFHICLTAGPVLAFIGYNSLFVGPATLTDIPEDYEPRHYEYHKNPIRRFLAKYFYASIEQAHELTLNDIYNEQCKQKMRALEYKVKQRMKEKQDYKAWYYIPVPEESQIIKQTYINEHGKPGYDVKFTK